MDPGEMERLEGYLENPSPTTVLVMAATKPDFRKKFFSALRSRGEVITCNRIPDWEISRWISERAKRMGLALPQDVVVYLKESVGNDLHRIVNELGKLQLIGSNERQLSFDIAREVIVGTRGHSVFDWLRALGGKDLSLAVQYLQELLEDGERPLFLLTMAIRQIHQMIQTKDHLSARGNPAELPRLLGFPPSLLPSFLQQSKLWSEEQLRQGLSLCLEIDVQVKGGALSGARLLEGLVFDLCQGSDRHSPKSLLI